MIGVSMTEQGVHGAEAFVAGIDLAGVPTYARARLAPGPPAFAPDAGSNQSVVVGSLLQGFETGVEEATRRAVQDVMLLAQLAARKRVEPDDNEAWYDTYFEVLSNIGLLVEDRSFTSSESVAKQADVHKAVLQLAAGLLGGAATAAYQIVAATLEALQKLDEQSPAVTIFRRETRHGSAGRFQLSVAKPDAQRGLALSLMAFTLEASTTVTQVLFFKTKAEEARLRHMSSTLSVNEHGLGALADQVAAKVGVYTDGYVKQLRI
jgi:hypothetical protein